MNFEHPRHRAIFDRLVTGGADPLAFSNRDLTSLLSNAAASPDPQVMAACLELDNRVDHATVDGFTPLSTAAFHDHAATIRLLLSAPCPANPNHVGRTMRSPLLIALEWGSVDAAEALLDGGASPNAQPLSFGVSFPIIGHVLHQLRHIGDDVEFLLKAADWPIEVNASGSDGLRLIHLVAGAAPFTGTVQLLEMLQRRGADLVAADRYGSTALHYALFSGNDIAIDWLLARAPGLAQQARHERLLPGDMSQLSGRAGLAESLPKTTKSRGTSGAGPSSLPTPDEEARLSLLHRDTAWETLPIAKRATASQLPENREFPLPEQIPLSTWTAVLRRRAVFRTEADLYLEETWWRRSDDGVCGISARIMSDSTEKGVRVEIDGTSPPIYDINQEFGIRLDTEERARAYLKVFCHAVRGEDRSFALCSLRKRRDIACSCSRLPRRQDRRAPHPPRGEPS